MAMREWKNGDRLFSILPYLTVASTARDCQVSVCSLAHPKRPEKRSRGVVFEFTALKANGCFGALGLPESKACGAVV